MTYIQHLLSEPYLLYPVLIVLGLCIGSFLNVVILRVPRMLEQSWRQQAEETLEIPDSQRTTYEPIGLASPNSHCPVCKREIRPWENIPLISYLMLRGRCAGCGTRISVRYPVIEVATALLTVLTVLIMGAQPASLLALLLVWTLVALAVIDFDTQLLPDNMTLPLLWLGLIVNQYEVFTSASSAFWGAVAGYLALWLVYHGFRLLTGKEGMGYGDFKLLAALGAWLGWELLPAVILLSSLVGAVLGIALIVLAKRGKEVPMPFGPYLAGAGLLALWWREDILAFWLHGVVGA